MKQERRILFSQQECSRKGRKGGKDAKVHYDFVLCVFATFASLRETVLAAAAPRCGFLTDHQLRLDTGEKVSKT